MEKRPAGVRAVFDRALEIEAVAERAAYLDEACAGSPELRQKVEALLHAYEEAGSFLERPAVPPGATGPLGPGEPAAEGPVREGPGSCVGPYKLLEPIGEGGMGAVWMAEQQQPVRRKVALKLIKAGLDSAQVVARFEAERQALALMDHPHIAKVFDGGTTAGGRPYFVMELVKGTPITRYCDEHRLTPRQRLELFVPVCQAIQHAHQKGIIHRDVKPSNVLVAPYDGVPVVKVIDFGVAKATGQPLTERTLFTGFGAVVGTLEYMSPEQAELNNQDIDTRSDVYSLGVLLYELLTGTTPLTKERLKQTPFPELLRLIREEEPPRPSTRLRDSETLPAVATARQAEPAKLTRLVRGELDWIVMKALEKDRGRRYETAAAFAADVGRYLAGEPVQAAPPRAGYRLRKFFGKHRGAVLAAGLVTLALVAGLVGTTLGLFQARAAEAVALEAREDERVARARAEENATRAEENATRANQQKALAEKRLAQIEKGIDVLASVLRDIDPRTERQGGRPLYEVLAERARRAADELDGEAVGDPLAVARLQTILGVALYELGDAPRAVTVLKKALATRERELGPDHAYTLATRVGLATAYMADHRAPEAVPLLERARDAQAKQPPTDPRAALITLANLAMAYQETGKLTEAIALHEQVCAVLAERLGDDHPDTLVARGNLAAAHRKAGDLTRAVPQLEAVRDALARRLGAEHLSTLTIAANLAEAYQQTGRLPEAHALFVQTRAAMAKRLGPEHPETLRALHNHAMMYQKDRKTLPEAVALFEQARAGQLKTLGAEHPFTLTTLKNLAQAYGAMGKAGAAVPLFEQLEAAQRKTLGPDDPATLTTQDQLAGAYWFVGRHAEAVVLMERARAVKTKRLGADHPETLGAGVMLALAHAATGKLDLARPLVEEAVRGFAAKKGRDHVQTKKAALLLQWLNQAQAALKRHERLRDAKGPDHLDTLLALRDIAQYQLLFGNFDQAEANLAAVLAGTAGRATDDPIRAFTVELAKNYLKARESREPGSWGTCNARSFVGGALLGLKKYAEAEPLLLAGYQGLKKRAAQVPAAVRTVRLTEALERLVALYEATGKKDEAAKWRKELDAAKAGND
jgi:serine/threonine protein kinase